MDIYQVEDFIKQMYPNKTYSFEFDDKCHRKIEAMFTDGKLNVYHHVECSKVKVNIDGMDSIYVPISTHRINTSVAALKGYIINKNEIYFHPTDIDEFKRVKNEDASLYQEKLKEWEQLTGLSIDEIEKKIS